MAGGAVGLGLELMLLEQVLHFASCAIDIPIQMFAASRQIGDNGADIRSLLGGFNAGNYFAFP